MLRDSPKPPIGLLTATLAVAALLIAVRWGADGGGGEPPVRGSRVAAGETTGSRPSDLGRDGPTRTTVPGAGVSPSAVPAGTAGPTVAEATLFDTPSRTIVRGRVLDEAGRPLAGARVRAYGHSAGEGRTSYHGSMRTFGDGTFELSSRTPFTNEGLLVVASHPDFLDSDGLELAYGSTGVELRLERGASLGLAIGTGRSGSLAEDLVLHVVAAEGGGPGYVDVLPREPGSDLSMVRGLETGSYRLSVVLRGTSWVLHEVDTTVRAGERLDLGSVDLVGRTRVLRLRVVDTAGKPRGELDLCLWDAEQRGYDRLTTGPGGLLTCRVPGACGNLTLSSYGKGSALVIPTTGTIKVVLAE